MKILILMLSLLSVATSLRILSVLPTATRSHYATGRRIMFELLRRGHEVVSISPYEEDVLTNFTWIPVEVRSFFKAVPNLREEINADYNFFNYQKYVWRSMNSYANFITKKSKLRNFIERDNSKFDLIFAEDFFLPVFYAFSQKYNCPMVIVTSYGAAQYINEYTGNPLELSYATHEFFELTDSENFFHRVQNFIYTAFDIIGRKLILVDYQNELAKELFWNVPNLLHLEDLERNVALVLLNSHFSVTGVRPNLPNVIEVGGVHIEEVKPLNQDIKSVLDGASNGAILFSFGSILGLESQPKEVVDDILSVLSKLKQRIIIKWKSNEDISRRFHNIYTFPWLPQNDILAHKNVVLFISHGGLLSMYEAIYHGVPLICIPFQASQPKNCKRITELGLGVYIKRNEINANVLKESIENILIDPTFKINATTISDRFNNRPMRAIDLAAFWIEYCAKYKRINFSKSNRNVLYEVIFNLKLFFVAWSLALLGLIGVIVGLFKYIKG